MGLEAVLSRKRFLYCSNVQVRCQVVAQACLWTPQCEVSGLCSVGGQHRTEVVT